MVMYDVVQSNYSFSRHWIQRLFTSSTVVLSMRGLDDVMVFGMMIGWA